MISVPTNIKAFVANNAALEWLRMGVTHQVACYENHAYALIINIMNMSNTNMKQIRKWSFDYEQNHRAQGETSWAGL